MKITYDEQVSNKKLDEWLGDYDIQQHLEDTDDNDDIAQDE